MTNTEATIEKVKTLFVTQPEEFDKISFVLKKRLEEKSLEINLKELFKAHGNSKQF